jgi:tetratricopeptide (TPR) repeat protein
MACNHAIELKPDWYAPYVDRGSTFLDRGELDKGLADLDRAIELNSWAPTAYLTRSLARFRLGDRDGALADASLAIQQFPQYGLVLPEFFLSAFKGHLDWAEAYYDHALHLLPNSALPYQGRADAYRANGRLEAAVADYDQAILRSPTQPAAYLGRGLAYQRLGDLKPAAADFRQALRRSKKSHLKRQAQELLEAVNPPALQRFITVTEGPARLGSRRLNKQR